MSIMEMNQVKKTEHGAAKPKETSPHKEHIFLDSFQRNVCGVQIYLITGIKMVGVIVGSDDFTILLSTKIWGTQLIYKHAITTISAYREDQ